MSDRYDSAENKVDYERGFVDGMQEQMRRIVTRAVDKTIESEPHELIKKLDVSLKNFELLQTGAKTAAWPDHVEQRIRTWRQRTMNRSGDMLAIDDFMGQDSINDLVDFVCDEWAMPPQYAVPEGYALIGIDSLKAWGVYEQVASACCYPTAQSEVGAA